MSFAEVLALVSAYAERLYNADWAGVGALFEHGALSDEMGNEIAWGADAVAAFYEKNVIMHGASPRTHHFVLNLVVDEPSADGSVTARSSYLVTQGLDGVITPIITGRYADRFERVAGSLVFAERRFSVTAVGDLSRHLRLKL